VVRSCPRRWLPVSAAIVLAVLSTGCLVTPPSRVTWPCGRDTDCLDGYVCRVRGGDPERTCARACSVDADCGPGSQCLPNGACALECSFDADGRALVACPEGLFCGRLEYPLSSAQAGDGLCGIVPTCATDLDCQPEEPQPGEPELRCASSALAAVRDLSNLPCLPTPTLAACPAGWVGSAQGCLPGCDTEAGAACPPGMACYERRLASIGAMPAASACFFGFYGAPCRDDLECFVGACLAGQCTVRCDEAARLSGLDRDRACAHLRENAGPLGVRLIFECAGDGAEDVCIARSGVGGGCGGPEDCVDGFACGEDGTCTRGCDTHDECLIGSLFDANPLASGYCDPVTLRCQPRVPEGSVCSFDVECETSLCTSPLLPVGMNRRCGRQRSVGAPCGRDAECTSGRCARSRTLPVGFCEER